MKIKIAYGPGEHLLANMALVSLQKMLPSAKVRKSDVHPPYKHIYIETPRPRQD